MKCLLFVINHYYYFVVLLSITMMLGLRDWQPFLILTTIIVATFCIRNMRWKVMDLLVCFYIFYSLISYLFSDYYVQLYYYGVKYQLIPTLFYFIGRSYHYKNDDFFENFKIPLLFSFICGLFLFFFPTEFYTSYKTSEMDSNISTKMFHELTRLSSFWPHSYFIGYTSLFFLIYLLKKFILENTGDWKYYLYLIIAVACLFFAQQRVSIAYFILFFCYLSLYSWYKKKGFNKIRGIWVIILFIASIISVIVINYLDSSYLEYVINRSTNEEGGLIEERIKLFDDYINTISILGEGLGKYGHAALIYNKFSISDCEYIRLANELGLFGSFIVLYIIIHTSIIGYKHLNIVFFETFCLFFFLIAMIGATPLEAASQNNYLLWFCVGHIHNKISIKNEYSYYNLKLQ